MKSRPGSTVREAAFRFVVQPDGALVQVVDDTAQALLGYSRHDFLSGRVALPGLIHRDDLDLVERLFAPGGAEALGSCNLRVRPADGRILCVKADFKKWTSRDGMMLDLWLQDARSLPRSLENVTASPFAAAMMENTDDYIYFKDRNHVFTGASQSIVALCSAVEHCSDLLGLTHYDVLSEPLADAWYSREKQVFADQPIATKRLETLTADGRKGWVDNRMYAMRDAVGTTLGLYCIARDVTARVEAETACAETARKYRALFEGAHDAVFLMQGDKFIDCNKRAVDMFACESRAQIVGHSPYEFSPPFQPDGRASPQAALQQINAALHGNLPIFEWTHSKCDGSVFPADVTLTATVLEGRTVLQAVVRDLTERKAIEAIRRGHDKLAQRSRLALLSTLEDRREAALAAAEDHARYRAMVDSMSDAIISADDLGNIVGWNAAAERIFGYAGPEILGKPFVRLMPARHHGAYLAGVAPRASGEPSHTAARPLDLDGLRKDGCEFPLSLTLSEWGAGGRQFTTAIIRDVTDSKRMDAERRVQGAALTAAANPIVITNRDGDIVWANPAFSAVTGYDIAEVIGRNPRELVKSGANDQRLYQDMWKTILGGDVWHGELTNRRKDGSMYPEEMTITPVRGADGAITNFVAVKRDLTAEKEQNAKFLQAQKMESVGRLAAGVAHDFNNLLTVILSYATFVEEDLPPDDQRREDIAQILSAGQSASSLTEQLLAFSRKQIVEPKVLRLNTIVVGTELMLRRLIGSGIAMKVTLEPDVWPVRADAGQLEQVLMNLVVNARDAMSGIGSLGVAVANVPKNEMPIGTTCGTATSDYVCLRVTDTGCGIDEDTRRRIFEPFFTTKEWGKGTGLGLSTVLGIVESSGGFVEVESQLGIGSTFLVYLPVANEPCATAEESHGEANACRGTETVLVVDDAAPIRQGVCAALRRLGYTVLEATDGHEALEVASAYPSSIQLLLTDVVMPRLNGPRLADQLMRVRPAIRVLYMSGCTQDALGEQGMLGVGIEFVRKPFTPGPLAAKVRQVLDAP